MSNYAFSHGDNGTVHAVRRVPNNLQPEIKPGFYSFCFDPEVGAHLHSEEPMKLPKDVYGDSHLNVDRYFRSFELNDKNLGISLVGLKGSGKTLQATQICIKGVELGYPVISVNKFFPAEIIAEFLKKIDQNVIMFIDEFDKHYFDASKANYAQAGDKSLQDGFLALLDGTNSTGKKMFVLTSNNPEKLSDLLKDRPSRVRYNVIFDLLPNDVLRDYVSRNLPNATEHDVASFFFLKKLIESNGDNPSKYFFGTAMNFDTMKELVHEMKQFKETLRESWSMMKFGSHNPPGTVPYNVDYSYRVLDKDTGKPVVICKIVNNDGDEEEILSATGRIIPKQLTMHREDSSFLDVRIMKGEGTLRLNDRIKKDHYCYKELLCYDRDYNPVYMDGDVIITVTPKCFDFEKMAKQREKSSALKEGKDEPMEQKSSSKKLNNSLAFGAHVNQNVEENEESSVIGGIQARVRASMREHGHPRAPF